MAQKGPAKFGNEDGGILSNAPPAPPFLSVCVFLPTIFIHRPPRTLSSEDEKEKKKRLSMLGNRFFSSLALLWHERERERERGLAIPVARASFQKNSVIFVLVFGLVLVYRVLLLACCGSFAAWQQQCRPSGCSGCSGD